LQRDQQTAPRQTFETPQRIEGDVQVLKDLIQHEKKQREAQVLEQMRLSQ